MSGTPTVTIDGNSASVTNTSGNNFTATYTLQSGDTEGALAFSITGNDAAGNALTEVTAVTNGSSVTFDETAPALTSVGIASDNSTSTLAKVGDTVTVSFTTDGSHSGTPTVTIDGNSASVTNTSGNNFTATYTLQSGDTEGALAFSISAPDAAGNVTAVTAVTNGSSVTFDETAPALTSVGIASDNSTSTLAKVGDTVTVSFTTDGSHSGTPTVTIDGNSASVTNTSGNNFTATYTLQSGDTEGALAFSISAPDAAGNVTAVTAVTNGSSVTFDETVPTLTSVGIASDNSTSTLAKVGDTVTVSFTASETMSGTPTVTIDGNSASVTNTSGNNFTATYTLQSGDTEGALAFSITGTDAAGNALTEVTAVTNGSSVTFDETAPALTSVGIALLTTARRHLRRLATQ